MLPIPAELRSKFEQYLKKRQVSVSLHGIYQKWLRYYLDFCQKYHFPPKNEKSLLPFIEKLREKKQSQLQQEQAEKAINLYYELLKQITVPCPSPSPRPAAHTRQTSLKNEKKGAVDAGPIAEIQYEQGVSLPTSAFNTSACVKNSSQPFDLSKNIVPEPKNKVDSTSALKKQISGASWKSEYARLADEIHLRHYSLKTLKTYQMWIKKMQAFTRSKPPGSLTTDDVKEFLTYLAVKRKMSASSQNQAFNALLFFYRHVLGKEFGKIEGVVRAKRKPYIPVVLSREEINAVLKYLAHIMTLLSSCFIDADSGFLNVWAACVMHEF